MNDRSAIQTLKARARRGDGAAAWRLGCRYAWGKRKTSMILGAGTVCVKRSRRDALLWLRRAVSLGERDAIPELADVLTAGGSEADTAEGIRLLRGAARRGNAGAAQNLAIVHSERGNPRRCMFWLRRTVELGDPDWFHLAIAYAAGYGCRRDLGKARRLFRKEIASTNAFPINQEEAHGFLSMIAHHREIKVVGSIGTVHPTP